jgi:large subunit ribosomal protein L32
LSFLGINAIYRAMVVRMRHNRSQTAQRRSHHALKAQKLAVCECGAPRVSHRACSACGRYRGRVVIDVAAKMAARSARKVKREKSEAQK